MASASLNPRRHRSDFPVLLEPVLTALLGPLEAEGAAVITLDGRGSTPVTLCQMGNEPPALLGQTELLVKGSQAPSHGVCLSGHPVLTGPWQLPPARRAVLVFWRGIGARPWKKQDHPLILTVATALNAVLKSVASSPKDTPWHSVIDIVTGLPRARKFVTDLPRHFYRLDREGLTGTMILVSIDGYSRLSAHLGRKAMEEVLRQTADLLTRLSRPTDVVARISDDEFAVWLNGADHFTAAERAEQLRSEAPNILAVATKGMPISLSVGIAARRSGSPETVAVIMQRADYAMHEAKRIGPGLWRVSQEEIS
jgi:diguanylate cyclase (GGDEF)-like protein